MIAVSGKEGELGTGRRLHPPDNEPHRRGVRLGLWAFASTRSSPLRPPTVQVQAMSQCGVLVLGLEATSHTTRHGLASGAVLPLYPTAPLRFDKTPLASSGRLPRRSPTVQPYSDAAARGPVPWPLFLECACRAVRPVTMAARIAPTCATSPPTGPPTTEGDLLPARGRGGDGRARGHGPTVGVPQRPAGEGGEAGTGLVRTPLGTRLSLPEPAPASITGQAPSSTHRRNDRRDEKPETEMA